MWLEHAFLSEMGEQFSSGDKLHEHIEIPGILSESFEIDLDKMGGTTKGWEMLLRIWY